MKIVDRIAQKKAEGKPYYSFEYFPPKTSQGLSNLIDRIGRMQSMSPTFVTCTWGAGGSTFEKTTELSAVAQTVHGLETCMHLTCTNMDRGKVDDALKEAKNAGIQNILALRGDPPRGQEYWTQVDDTFVHAIDLVRYIRQQYGDYFCIGVAGYPEGHMDNTTLSSDEEILFLKEKIDAGANFVLTQLFYDVEGFLAWEKKCRSHGIVCPIIPGIMPIQSYNGFRRITNLAKIRIPATVTHALEPIKTDDQKVKDYGVELAASIIDSLLKAGISGFHICTLNLEKSVRLILERVGFIPSAASAAAGKQQKSQLGNDPAHPNLSGTPAAAAATAAIAADTHLNPLIWKAPDSTHGHSESWDDFPNGRWGDARSPAFGDLDGYGASLKVEPAKALEMWRRPKNTEDISQLFVQFIQGKIPLLPWSEGSPLPETEAIQSKLVACNERGLWTVGSQPAVNGKPSTDPLVGWGPKGGYVYQKGFLELFVGPNEVEAMIQKLRTVSPWITFLAASRDGDIVTNTTGDVLEEQRKIAELKKVCGKKQSDLDSSARISSPTTNTPPVCATPFISKAGDELVEGPNALTWGVFPGKEIIQPTVIEKVSFLAWRDEAFEIWREWEHLYPKGSESRKLLHQIGHDYWLLNVVHNDYRNENGIWDILITNHQSSALPNPLLIKLIAMATTFKFGPHTISAGQVFFKTKHSLGLVNLKPILPGRKSPVQITVKPRNTKGRERSIVSDIFQSSQKIGTVIEKEYGGTSLTIACQDGPEAGQSVPHCHIHIIPRRLGDFANNDDIYNEITQNTKELLTKSDPAAETERKTGVDNEERKPRSEQEMAQEALRLASFFQEE
ncbi:hypothetical protein BGX21_010193 [Mortierella sp. AD011]|nr:hypothetical protein BGX21_010193 [Mortierella sp. AD011]